MLFLAAASSSATNCAQGQTIASGTEVLLKPGAAPPEVDGRAVTDAATYRRYRVERIDDGRLWVTSGRVAGSLAARDVIRFDRAVPFFTGLIREHPDAPAAYNGRAMVWADRHDPEIAILDYTAAIERAPNSAIVHGNRGLAWLAKKDYARAAADFDAAIRLDPKDPAFYRYRGLARAGQGDRARAIADYDQAIRIAPKDAAAHRDRAIVEAQRGEYARATADYTEAILLNPNDPWAANGLAWLLATAPEARQRDVRKAIALATRANELSGGKDPYQLGTLAAALAETGDFAAAVKRQTHALELFPTNDPDLLKHRARLELYRSKKPYREPAPKAPSR